MASKQCVSSGDSVSNCFRKIERNQRTAGSRNRTLVCCSIFLRFQSICCRLCCSRASRRRCAGRRRRNGPPAALRDMGKFEFPANTKGALGPDKKRTPRATAGCAHGLTGAGSHSGDDTPGTNHPAEIPVEGALDDALDPALHQVRRRHVRYRGEHRGILVVLCSGT